MSSYENKTKRNFGYEKKIPINIGLSYVPFRPKDVNIIFSILGVSIWYSKNRNMGFDFSSCTYQVDIMLKKFQRVILIYKEVVIRPFEYISHVFSPSS